MKKRVLIAFSDIEEAEVISDILEKQLDRSFGSVNTKIRRYMHDALDQMERKKFDLVIVDYRLPKMKKSTEIKCGMELLHSLKNDGVQIPSILVTHIHLNRVLRSTYGLYRCRYVVQGEEFEESLMEASNELLSAGQIDAQQKEIEAIVDITLDPDEKQFFYAMEGRFPENNFQACGKLMVDQATLEDLIEESRSINPKLDQSRWKKDLKKIGKTLEHELFVNNYNFSKHFHKLEEKAGGKQNIRMRFMIHEKIYPLMLEAIYEKYAKERLAFRMLKSPIYRKLQIDEESDYPAFAFRKLDHSKKTNFLIIAADVSEGVPELQVASFDKLKKLKEETNYLQNLLLQYDKQFHLEIIDNEMWSSQEQSFADLIKEKLRSRNWHIVHYAGHSYYDEKGVYEAGRGGENRRQGFIILPNQDYPFPLKAGTFGMWLRESRAQMLFLSSCRSSEDTFVFDLAACGVPTIIGFRWDLKDKMAVPYVKKFYEYYIERNYGIEQAFLQSRKEMHKMDRNDPIWASPILIMQC